MGYSICYRSTSPLTREKQAAVRRSANQLCKGRTWLSSEPVWFMDDGPNILPFPQPND
jgi:hypothetical protein